MRSKGREGGGEGEKEEGRDIRKATSFFVT